MEIGLEQTEIRALAMKPEIIKLTDDFKTIAESQTKFEAGTTHIEMW